MRKTTIYFWLDLTIALAFVADALSGLALSVFARGWLPVEWAIVRWVYAVGRFTWLRWHDWSSVVLVVGVVLHVVFHWRWVVTMAKRLWREAFNSTAD